MKVEGWFSKKFWVAQTYKEGLEYAFLSSDNKQCGPFVFCKEFLIDSVWAQLHQVPINLYNFLYDPRPESPDCDPAVDLHKCRVLLRHRTDPSLKDRVGSMLNFMNGMEDLFGFKRSTLAQVENPPPRKDPENEPFPTYCLSSPKRWMHAPPLLSFYALLVRVGMGFKGNPPEAMDYIVALTQGKERPYSDRDHWYLYKALNTIKDLIETKCKRFHHIRIKNWPRSVRQLDLHEDSGIVSLATGFAKRVCPDWYPKPAPAAETAQLVA